MLFENLKNIEFKNLQKMNTQARRDIGHKCPGCQKDIPNWFMNYTRNGIWYWIKDQKRPNCELLASITCQKCTYTEKILDY